MESYIQAWRPWIATSANDGPKAMDVDRLAAKSAGKGKRKDGGGKSEKEKER